MHQSLGRVQSKSLTGWKEISSYLEVSPRTAQLWEKRFGLPVKRIGGSRGAVHISISELEAWRRSRTEAPAPEQPAIAEPPRKRLVYVAAAVAALLLAVVGWSVRPRTTTTVRPPDRSVEMPDVTADAGGFALSPDGRRAALAAVLRGEDFTGLYLADLTTGESKTLVPHIKYCSPVAWSPDGRRIAYFADGNTLFTIPSAGGRPTRIAELPGTVVSGVHWREDGRAILAGVLSAGILEIDLGSNSVTPLLNHPHADSAQYVRHNGRRAVLFSGENGNPEGFTSAATPHQVSLLDLESKTVEELFTVATSEPKIRYHPAGYVLHSAGPPEHPQVVATPIGEAASRFYREPIVISTNGYRPAVARNGSVAILGSDRLPFQLTWFDRSGRPTGRIGKRLTWMEKPTISPDGKRALVQGTDGIQNSLWLMDGESATAIDSSEYQMMIASWRRDGRVVAHRTFADRISGLAIIPVDRPDEARAHPIEDFIPYDWSVNGKTLLGSKAVGNDLLLWTAPADGSGPGRAVLRMPGDHWDGRWSPDGRLMSYGRKRGDERRVFVRWADAAEDDPGVLVAEGRQPRWIKDGAELVYERGGTLYSVAIRIENGNIISAAPDQEHFRLPDGTHKKMYDVSPDGERILVAHPQAENPGPFAIEVWSELKLP